MVCAGHASIVLITQWALRVAQVEYLAHRTGHRFVRINNHEQTDLREYVGTYATNEQGQFVFVDGPLVQALRHGFVVTSVLV